MKKKRRLNVLSYEMCAPKTRFLVRFTKADNVYNFTDETKTVQVDQMNDIRSKTTAKHSKTPLYIFGLASFIKIKFLLINLYQFCSVCFSRVFSSSHLSRIALDFIDTFRDFGAHWNHYQKLLMTRSMFQYRLQTPQPWASIFFFLENYLSAKRIDTD